MIDDESLEFDSDCVPVLLALVVSDGAFVVHVVTEWLCLLD